MESVVSKLQETGQHAAKKSEAILARTREAGEAFLDEVRDAGRDIVVFARTETKGWKRYFTQTRTQLKTEARQIFTVPAIERRLLVGVGGTLRTLDAKVRARLVALDKRGAKKKASNGKAHPAATRKAKSASASAPAAVRH